jgi:hypothetical protein
VQLEDLRRRARELADSSSAASFPAESADALRRDVVGFFARVPEPPVYRRRDDPAQARALQLIDEGVGLLARAGRVPGATALVAALEAHLEAQCLVADHRVEAAEPAWARAVALERDATAELRLWRRSDEGTPAVFDRATGKSRFDPAPEAKVHATLACPGCRKVGEFDFSPQLAMHAFACRHCARPFHAYFGELRTLEVRPRGGGGRQYVFRVDELGGAQARVEFDDSSSGELTAAHRDLLAFIYEPKERLRGVLNLNTSRVLWLPTGACFVATVAFGDEAAPELDVLRGFRDRVLARSQGGRRFIDWYYREGPALARRVAAHPPLRLVVRAALGVVVRVIARGSDT